MGIMWKKKVKKWIAEAMLGMLLAAPVVVSAVEAPPTGILQAEVSEKQESVSGGILPEGSLAVGELPGDDGAGIVPCGDLEKEKDTAATNSQV